MSDTREQYEIIWSAALERSGQAAGLSSFPARVTVPARGGAANPDHPSRRRAAALPDDEED
jgi:hypothetical protein